jgi:RNA polymerase sigma factor (sigma-70 family)
MPASEPAFGNQTEGDWLSTRAEAIVSRNPGEAFPEHDREFFDATLRLIRQFVRARIQGRSYALFNGDDLAQEVYLRVVHSFPEFRGTRYRTWIYIIVRNAFYSMLRADRHTAALSLEEIISLQSSEGRSSEDLIADQIDVAEDVDAKRVMSDFLAWLHRRNAKHARIVELDLDGLKDEEIAERVGVAYRTVCSVLRRAPIDYQKFLGRTRKEKYKQAQRTGGQ